MMTVLAAARHRQSRITRSRTPVRGGAEAVARVAYVPGGSSAAEIAARYERLRAQAKRSHNVGHQDTPRHPGGLTG
jgi:hypothetical protein